MKTSEVRLRETHADETGVYYPGEVIRVDRAAARQLVDGEYAEAIAPIPEPGSIDDVEDAAPAEAGDADGWGDEEPTRSRVAEGETSHVPATRRRRRPS